jgi:hypothetical protein
LAEHFFTDCALKFPDKQGKYREKSVLAHQMPRIHAEGERIFNGLRRISLREIAGKKRNGTGNYFSVTGNARVKTGTPEIASYRAKDLRTVFSVAAREGG